MYMPPNTPPKNAGRPADRQTGRPADRQQGYNYPPAAALYRLKS